MGEVSKKRRTFLSGLTGLTGLTGIAGGLGALGGAPVPHGDSRPLAPDDPTKLQGPPPTEVGERSPFETPRRTVMKNEPASSSRTPLQDLSGIVTPSDLHFERHHAGVPRIDPERYTLLIHGLVERPTIFTLADLKRFPSVSRLLFLECSGNGGEALRDPKPDLTPQEIDGLTSVSEWTGVPLALLFREVGALAESRWFLAEGSDAAVMTRSVPMGKGVGRRDDRLRPEWGGAPAGDRLSRAALPSRLGRKREREMDSKDRARRASVLHPRGDRQVHRSSPGR